MRRRYSSSRFRLVLLAALFGTLLFTLLSKSAFAAGDAPADAPAAVPQGVMSLILHHIDPVSITIGILSILGLTLIIQGFMKNRREVLMPEATTETMRDLISRKQLKELMEFTETDQTFVSRALNSAIKRAPSFSAMKEAMETSVGEQTADQFRKIEYLNIIGNLGPLLGLLGTVLGMIEAFDAMYAAGGNAKPAELAGGIATALCHTLLGLALAIPCLAAFGVLRTMVDRLTVQGALIAEELLLLVKPQEQRSAPPAGPSRLSAPTAAPAPRKPAMPIPAPIPAPTPVSG